MEVIKFTSQIYAVKGTRIPSVAAKAVARKRKKSLCEIEKYDIESAYVGDYGKDELGLWFGGKNGKFNCIAIMI